MICNNFCLKFFFVHLILRHKQTNPPPPQKKKKTIVHLGRRPNPGGDFAHMQSQLKFLSYKIAYQIWLSWLNYFLSYSVQRQTDRHIHRRHAKNDFFFFGLKALKTWRSIKIKGSVFWTNAILPLSRKQKRETKSLCWLHSTMYRIWSESEPGCLSPNTLIHY